MNPETLITRFAQRYPRPRFESAEAGPRLLHCGDPLGELRAVTERAAWTPCPFLEPLEIAGADATDYLHRRLTRNVRDVPVGGGAHALLLEGDGTIADELLLYRTDKSWLALTPHGRAAGCAERLDRYVLGEDVAVRDLSAARGVLGVFGPRAGEALAESGLEASHAWSAVNVEGGFALADPRWPAVWLVVTAGHTGAWAERIEHAVSRVGGRACGEHTLDALRIERGIPRFGLDFDETTRPLEVGMHDAIDFDKGCFPGQEVLARTHNLGHPARVLVRIRADCELPVAGGAVVFGDDEAAGAIGTWSTLADRSCGLAQVKWSVVERDGRLDPAREVLLRLGDVEVAVSAVFPWPPETR